jgi:dTDP-glucose 4,6-dehydratase
LLSSAEVKSISSRFDFDGFADKRILVTGASGLVGSYLVDAILKCTDHMGNRAPTLIAISKSGNFSSLMSQLENPRLATLTLDLEHQKVDFEYELLIHAASTASPTKQVTRETLLNVNCNTLKNLYEKPGSVERVLFISTGEVYGAQAPKNVPEDYIGIIDDSNYRADYPDAKLRAEKLTLGLSNCGIEGRIARLFHSFGPGVRIDDGRSFADFLWAASLGQPPTLRTSGTQIRSFLYLEDTIVGLLKILDSDFSTPVNLGSEVEVSILDFAKAVSEVAGFGGVVNFENIKSDTMFSPNDIVLPSAKKLRDIGWNQEISIHLGIERTLNWIGGSKLIKA